MMTSVYPPTGPQYFHEPASIAFDGTKVQVKREPSEDNMMDTERPVDMTLSAREHQPNIPRHLALGSDLSGADRAHMYSSYIHNHHHQSHQNHRHTPQNYSKHMDQLLTPPVDSCPPSISPSTSTSSVESFQLKSSDGKLTVPAILTKNGRNPSFRTVDLLPVSTHQRAKREFVPDEKKDDNYWCKRLKNNDSARRSRVKRKALEKMMETRLLELQKENIELKHEMAALKRRFGMEDSSSSSETPSPTEETNNSSSSPAPSSSPEETFDKHGQREELEQQSAGSDDSRSNDDSRVYSMGSVAALSHALGPASRDRTDSMGSSSSSLTSSRVSTGSRPGSRGSQPGSVDVSLRTDVTGAIDLTNDHNNRSPPGWESSSSSGYSSNGNRRYSCVSSDGSCMEDAGNRSMKVFPLKCRWKKESHSAHNHISEELQ